MSDLTISIAKGRLQERAFDLFRRVGLTVSKEALESRRLLIDDDSGRYSFIFVKPSDAPVYLKRAAIAGLIGALRAGLDKS